MILIGRRELVVARPESHDPRYYEGKDYVSMLHVTALEDIEQPAGPPSANGLAHGA